MNNEPNREQELTEKELKGIAGGLSRGLELPEEVKTIVKVEEPADTSVARAFDPARADRKLTVLVK